MIENQGSGQSVITKSLMKINELYMNEKRLNLNVDSGKFELHENIEIFNDTDYGKLSSSMAENQGSGQSIIAKSLIGINELHMDGQWLNSNEDSGEFALYDNMTTNVALSKHGIGRLGESNECLKKKKKRARKSKLMGWMLCWVVN